MMEPSAPVTLGTRFRYGLKFLACVVGFVLTQVFAGGLATVLVGRRDDSLAFDSIFRPLGLVLLVLFCGGMAKLLDRTPASLFEAQGLGLLGRWKQEFGIGLLLGTGMILFSVAAIVLFGRYRAELLPAQGMAMRIVAILWVGFTAATLEEVAFRGYPFQTLVKSIGPWGATLMLSVLFGALHLANPHASAVGFTNTALVSVLLSLAYLRTGSLWMPIGIHFAWNMVLGTVFGLPVSGVNLFATVLKGHATGHPLLTGGDYGIEASLPGTAVILLGTIALYFVTRREKEPQAGTPTPV